MSDPIEAMALAQRFRQDARQTDLPEFARKMLLAAEELEALARNELAILTSHSPLRLAG
jgi:hypothetical protein